MGVIQKANVRWDSMAAMPPPGQGMPSDVDAELVTPGLWGFGALFVLAVVVFFLGASMARRVRGVELRSPNVTGKVQHGRESPPEPQAKSALAAEPELHVEPTLPVEPTPAVDGQDVRGNNEPSPPAAQNQTDPKL